MMVDWSREKNRLIPLIEEFLNRRSFFVRSFSMYSTSCANPNTGILNCSGSSETQLTSNVPSGKYKTDHNLSKPIRKQHQELFEMWARGTDATIRRITGGHSVKDWLQHYQQQRHQLYAVQRFAGWWRPVMRS